MRPEPYTPKPFESILLKNEQRADALSNIDKALNILRDINLEDFTYEEVLDIRKHVTVQAAEALS